MHALTITLVLMSALAAAAILGAGLRRRQRTAYDTRLWEHSAARIRVQAELGTSGSDSRAWLPRAQAETRRETSPPQGDVEGVHRPAVPSAPLNIGSPTVAAVERGPAPDGPSPPLPREADASTPGAKPLGMRIVRHSLLSAPTPSDENRAGLLPSQPSPWMTVRDVSDETRLSETYVRQQMHAGELPYTLFGSRMRVRRCSYEAWIAKHERRFRGSFGGASDPT